MGVVVWGAETRTALEEFGERKQVWLQRFLAHDTFRRVFSLLPAEAFETRPRHSTSAELITPL